MLFYTTHPGAWCILGSPAVTGFDGHVKKLLQNENGTSDSIPQNFILL